MLVMIVKLDETMIGKEVVYGNPEAKSRYALKGTIKRLDTNNVWIHWEGEEYEQKYSREALEGENRYIFTPEEFQTRLNSKDGKFYTVFNSLFKVRNLPIFATYGDAEEYATEKASKADDGVQYYIAEAVTIIKKAKPPVEKIPLQ